jgi:hypothetical protein
MYMTLNITSARQRFLVRDLRKAYRDETQYERFVIMSRKNSGENIINSTVLIE